MPRRMSGCTCFRSGNSNIQILSTLDNSEIKKIPKPNRAPTPSISGVQIRIRTARTIPQTPIPTLLKRHTLIHPRTSGVRQFHSPKSAKPISVFHPTLPLLTPHAPFSPIHRVPLLQPFRHEPIQALANRRPRDRALSVGSARVVHVAAVYRQRLVNGPGFGLRNPRDAVAEIEGLVHDDYGDDGSVPQGVSVVDLVCVVDENVIVEWVVSGTVYPAEHVPGVGSCPEVLGFALPHHDVGVAS